MNPSAMSEYFQGPVTLSPDTLITDLVKNPETRLDKLLEILESHLTSKEIPQRSKAVKLLAQLLTQLPTDRLNKIEVDLFVTFFCSKLEDHYSVSIPCLPALSRLIHQQDLISLEKSVQVVKSILRDIHVQSMVQADRLVVFTICQFVLNSTEIVSQIIEEKYSTDFVYGFIQAMDGEKDPRNLLVCFDCIRLTCEKLSLGPFVEETFEVFACYFPIDFNPPKNDSFVITKDMIISSLRACFAAHRGFSKFAVPLFVEKLNSSNEECFSDALLTFAQCSKTNYDPNDYADYLESVWSYCQKTVLNTSKSELEEAALEAIEALAFSIGRTVQAGAVSIDSFMTKAMQNPINYLSEPDLKLVWPSVKCLHALAKGSSTCSLIVNKKCVPLLIEHFSNATLQNQKKTYLDILWQFVSNSSKFGSNPSTVLTQSSSSLLAICLDNFSNKHLSSVCLTGLIHLLGFNNLLEKANQLDPSHSNYYAVASALWHPLWTGFLPEEQNRLVEIFYLLGKNDKTVLEWLLSSLRELLTSDLQAKSQLSLDILKSLAGFLANDSSDKSDCLAVELIEIFGSVFKRQGFSGPFLSSCLEAVGTVSERLAGRERAYEVVSSGLEKLVYRFLEMVSVENPGDESVQKIAYIFKVYSANLKATESAKAFLIKLNEVFVIGSSHFRPLELDASLEQKATLSVLLQTVASIDKRAFKIEIESFFIAIRSRLIVLATEINESQSRLEQNFINLVACQLYASLLNKLETDSLIEAELTELNDQLVKDIEAENTGSISDKYMRSLSLWVWLTKALALREYKTSEKFSGKLVEWLDRPLLSEKCSEAFGTIMNNEAGQYSVMTDKKSANVRLLFRQRFFERTVHALKAKFDSEESVHKYQKIFYMIAIINMLNHLPRAILQQHVKLMMPILLYSLSTSEICNEQLWLSSLKSLELLIDEAAQKNNRPDRQAHFLEFTTPVLERLLKVCNHQANMEVRLLALGCVNNLGKNVAPAMIIKNQKMVCRQLEACLNDRKRLCRQMAVEARNRWFLISTKVNQENQ